jgi:DNA-binding CsgD family transcriptional regulator
MQTREQALSLATTIGSTASPAQRLTLAMGGLCEDFGAHRLTCFTLDQQTTRHDHYVRFVADARPGDIGGCLALGDAALPEAAAAEVALALSEAGPPTDVANARAVNGSRYEAARGLHEHFAWVRMPVQDRQVFYVGIARGNVGGRFEEIELTHLVRSTWLMWLALDHRASNEPSPPMASPLHELAHAMPVGIAVVTAEREVLFMNSTLQAMLRDGDGLGLVDNRIVATRGQDDLKLSQLVQAATSPATNGPTEHCMALPRPSARPPYGVLVRSTPAQGNHRTVAALHVSDSDRGLDLSRTAVRAVLGLTPTESEIASRLADGEDIEAIVRVLGIQAATVRVHLRNIYRKTNITRQSELVRLVLRSVALFTRR